MTCYGYSKNKPPISNVKKIWETTKPCYDTFNNLQLSNISRQKKRKIFAAENATKALVDFIVCNEWRHWRFWRSYFWPCGFGWHRLRRRAIGGTTFLHCKTFNWESRRWWWIVSWKRSEMSCWGNLSVAKSCLRAGSSISHQHQNVPAINYICALFYFFSELKKNTVERKNQSYRINGKLKDPN